MIKDIVVNLSVGGGARPAGDYAVSVAAAFDAHLAGIAFLYDPIVPVSGAGYIPAELVEAQERDSVAAAKVAIDRFVAASTRAGVAAEPLTLAASFAGVGDQFGRIARRFDLAIVGQAEPETSAVEEVIIEGALFGSGRPIIVVPYIQKAPLKLDRVMVCWDGGRQAARAIHAFLQHLGPQAVGEMPEDELETASTLPADGTITLDLRRKPRAIMPLRPREAAHDRSIEFAAGFTEEQARREASRCLRCDLAYLCPSVKLAGNADGQTKTSEMAESLL